MLKIQRYAPAYHTVWDQFVQTSRNGTFLFLRNYMEYHQDRFVDHSLLIYDEIDQLIALLPANLAGETVVSHGGLTYGGFIIADTMKTPLLLDVFAAVLTYLQAYAHTFIYKPVPHIYHRVPAEEDLYALYLCHARLTARSIYSVVDQHQRLPFQERRLRAIKKAVKQGLEVRQSQDFAAYWDILTGLLQQRHSTAPVHSLVEIQHLQQLFPNNIKLYGCYQQDTLVAGVLIYETHRVARSQYIAASEGGKAAGALDLIFDQLINHHYRGKRYFDFANSDTHGGQVLNTGLIEQKEGFGARAIVVDRYEINLSDFQPGLLQVTQ